MSVGRPPRAGPRRRAGGDVAAGDAIVVTAGAGPWEGGTVAWEMPRSWQDGLASRIDASSTGRLFHHLKDLLAAGLVHQPVRGTYALRRTHVVPLLAALSCALDLAGPDTPGDDR